MFVSPSGAWPVIRSSVFVPMLTTLTVVRVFALPYLNFSSVSVFVCQIQDLAIRCIQKNIKKNRGVKGWPWWKLFTTVRPLIEVQLTEEQIRGKDVSTHAGFQVHTVPTSFLWWHLKWFKMNFSPPGLRLRGKAHLLCWKLAVCIVKQPTVIWRLQKFAQRWKQTPVSQRAEYFRNVLTTFTHFSSRPPEPINSTICCLVADVSFPCRRRSSSSNRSWRGWRKRETSWDSTATVWRAG